MGDTTLIALTDEKSLAVNVAVEPIEVGFLIILICANFVSVGKSFVESSISHKLKVYQFLVPYISQNHVLWKENNWYKFCKVTY